jgi:hypothetical protein
VANLLSGKEQHNIDENQVVCRFSDAQTTKPKLSQVAVASAFAPLLTPFQVERRLAAMRLGNNCLFGGLAPTSVA